MYVCVVSPGRMCVCVALPGRVSVVYDGVCTSMCVPNFGKSPQDKEKSLLVPEST